MKNNEYEKYHETAANYDQTRTPVGLEIVLGCFAAAPQPLSDQTILDAGCGTGSYIKALSDKLGYLHGLEFNENMLSEAQKKLKETPNVRLGPGELPNIPYDEQSFDGLMFHQVIHHLGDDNSRDEFDQIHKLIQESHRVLRPDQSVRRQGSQLGRHRGEKVPISNAQGATSAMQGLGKERHSGVHWPIG